MLACFFHLNATPLGPSKRRMLWHYDANTVVNFLVLLIAPIVVGRVTLNVSGVAAVMAVVVLTIVLLVTVKAVVNH